MTSLNSVHSSNDFSAVLSLHKHLACILWCVMLAINQPVGQIDTNQPWTSSHTACLLISEMAGTTHSVPSALHFILKCLYHLCAHLVHTWGTFWGVGAAGGLRHFVTLVLGEYLWVVFAEDVIHLFHHTYDLIVLFQVMIMLHKKAPYRDILCKCVKMMVFIVLRYVYFWIQKLQLFQYTTEVNFTARILPRLAIDSNSSCALYHIFAYKYYRNELDWTVRIHRAYKQYITATFSLLMHKADFEVRVGDICFAFCVRNLTSGGVSTVRERKSLYWTRPIKSQTSLIGPFTFSYRYYWLCCGLLLTLFTFWYFKCF